MIRDTRKTRDKPELKIEIKGCEKMEFWILQVARSFGAMLVWIVPIGLLYGKLIRRLHFGVIALGLVFGALVDTVMRSLIGDEHYLAIGSIACVIGIEIGAQINNLRRRTPTIGPST